MNDISDHLPIFVFMGTKQSVQKTFDYEMQET